MRLTTDGLIVKEQKVGENDRLVTALTRDKGLIRAFARGALGLKNKNGAGTGLFCYSQLTLFSKGDTYTIDEAALQQSFFSLRKDIVKLSLAQYFCEIAIVMAPRETEAEDFLRLLLNALYLLSETKRPALLIKAAVELKTACLAGYMPDAGACAQCGTKESAAWFFNARSGLIFCDSCRPPEGTAVELPYALRDAVLYISGAEVSRVFGFQLSDNALEALSKMTEYYLQVQAECGFSTLEFYYSIARPM